MHQSKPTATPEREPKANGAQSQGEGVKMGRKPVLSAQQVAHARKLREQGESPAHVAQLLTVSRRTLERALHRTR